MAAFDAMASLCPLLFLSFLPLLTMGSLRGIKASSPCPMVQYTAEVLTTYDLVRLKNITGPELEEFMAGSPMHTFFRGKFPDPKYQVRLVKVSYLSVVPEMGNKETIATGLVAFPLIASTRL
eukprot:RCo035958